MSEGPVPILYIAPWVDLGGSDKGTIDWFKSLDRERWAPSLITTQPSANRWLHHLEPYAEEIWDLPDLMPGDAFPEFILGFIESRRVQLVHMMNSRLAFDLLPDMSVLPEPPSVVVQLHAEEPNQDGYVRYVARRYGNLVDAFSVTSGYLRGVVAGYDIPPSRVELIHSGIDAAGEFNPEGVEPFELGGSKPRVLWPGRLAEQKDPMLTLDVILATRERGVEFVLDVVGDGPMKEDVQRRASELGIAEAIEWHPPSQEMPRWYRSADLVLMTSTYEGVPYVVYESLAMGVPIVAPALPGNVEFMDDDSGVLVAPRDDVELYAEAIAALLNDPTRRRRLGERSRERMLAEFSLEEMSRRHSELYRRLLDRRASTFDRRRDRVLAGDPVSFDQAPADSVPAPLRLSRDPKPARTIGVIVPCYRHGVFLEACIGSIKAQTLRPDRIVVVDDGSDDAETIEALALLDEDPEVSVLRQPANLGPSAARNRALGVLDTNYVLPIDADDELLPGALELMLGQLEEAADDIGFIYPHIQYIGNRTDYAESPAYDLWLLMQQNYCPAPALFDRRVFAEGGASYAEEIVVGHEDWDLILQLAEHGVGGAPADGPTFLYRKQGFSRANAADYAPDAFDRMVEERHPALYRDSDEIKARWCPALSIVLLDDDLAWGASDLASLSAQTCRDFELLARTDLEGSATVVAGGVDPPAAWLQDAIHQARGRWVLLMPHSAAAAFGSKSFVEQLLRAFTANDGVAGLVLAESPGDSRHQFAQLDDLERLSAAPAAIAFERLHWGRMPSLELSKEGSPLADIGIGLQAIGGIQWRVAPVARAGAPWRERSPEATAGQAPLDLNLPMRSDPVGAAGAKRLHQPPRLPGGAPGAKRRCDPSQPWAPPQSHPLCRYVDPKTELRMVIPGYESLPGYEFERVLGSAHTFPVPGTKRLVQADGGFTIGGERDALAEGEYDLGYVEDQALPSLLPLELYRLADTGQEVLVAGAGDPLAYISERLATLGWIEACPILPWAADVLHLGPWAVDSLRRSLDPDRWRHTYFAEDPREQIGGAEVGLIQRCPGPEMVALRLRSDGRLVSELCAPGRASRDPRKLGRWLAEPVIFGDSVATRAAGAKERLGHLTLRSDARRLADEEGVALGYLRRQNGPGSSTLYSTVHPVTGDQLVTRFPEEAGEQGYVLDGILGSILDPIDGGEDGERSPLPWGRLPRRG
jgi:glycosyltransferase involved in cell wall biosynthesis